MAENLEVRELSRHSQKDEEHPMRKEERSEGWVTGRQMNKIFPVRISDFPWWLSSKEYACQCRRYCFDPWSGQTH